MATIYNNTSYTFSPSSQQAINNACANLGVDEVHTSIASTDGGNSTLFNLFDTFGDYVFSIDTEGDVIYETYTL